MTRTPAGRGDFSSFATLKTQPVTDPAVAVLVRVKNERKAIGAFLASLRAQSIFDRTEVVVLDSGSTDGTLDELMAFPASVYAIAPHEFSFGSSCNLICGLASAPVLCLMSGHVTFDDPTLLERACAAVAGPSAPPLSAAYFRQVPSRLLGSSSYERAYLRKRFPPGTAPVAMAAGRHAFSNAGSIFTRESWTRNAFPDIVASEDHVWAEAHLASGGLVQYLPFLSIEHSHAEQPASVARRVSINVQARYGQRRLWWRACKSFVGVCGACLLEGASPAEAARFAAAHARPYIRRLAG